MNSIRNIQQSKYKKYSKLNWERKEKLRRLKEIAKKQSKVTNQKLDPLIVSQGLS